MNLAGTIAGSSPMDVGLNAAATISGAIAMTEKWMRGKSTLSDAILDVMDRDKFRNDKFFVISRRDLGTPETYRIVYYDPMAIDLDGDGIRTGTGWLKGDDAWLVRDINGNGKIDTGAEIFGYQTKLPYAVAEFGKPPRDTAKTGLEALRALDENRDGKITAADDAFFSLQVWQDKNENGKTDEGELKTLQEAGRG